MAADGDDDLIDYIEVPSCLESLAHSASQLKQLAELTCQYYIKGLISYGYIHEVKFAHDSKQQQNGFGSGSRTKVTTNKGEDGLFTNRNALESLGSLVDVLPFLDELSKHVEKCFTTIEMTFRRLNYHLNKSNGISSRDKTSGAGRREQGEFRPPPEARFDPIFVAMMDLLYAIVSLDETIKSHTSLRESLSLLRRACQRTIEELDDRADKLEKLVLMIREIESTICDDNRSVFQQCLDHLQHLDLILMSSGSNKGSGPNIAEHLSDFIVFYAENLNQNPPPGHIPTNLRSSRDISLYLLQANMAPTLYMTSLQRKVLGLSCLFILHNWIFEKTAQTKKRPDSKRHATTRTKFNQMLAKLERINLVNLAESNIYLSLCEFLVKYSSATPNLIEAKALTHLSKQDADQYLSLNLAQYSNELAVEVTGWMVKLEMLHTDKGEGTLEEAAAGVPNELSRTILEEGLDLVEEINTTIKSTISAHLKHGRAITRNNLVILLRLVALLKSIESSATGSRNRKRILQQQLDRERWLRLRWRKLMSTARKRCITSRYSDRKLDTSSSLVLFALCSHLIDRYSTQDDTSRSLLFMATSMLASTCLNAQESNDLNVLLSQMRPEIMSQRLELAANCAYLYWNVPTFSAYYNYVFEIDPTNIREISYFHAAIDDIQQLFAFDKFDSTRTSLGWLVEKRDQFVDRLGTELMDQFRSSTLDKICQEFEIELRLQTHRDLHLDGHNPFRRHLYNFKRIFADRTEFRIFTGQRAPVSLRQYVEQHLSEIYYNLTSLAPHDWFSYDCMINFARRKYGLQIVGSQMPTQTIDCGVDLMELTRNLALFVSRYTYDMSNQLFVEKCSNRLSSTSSAASVISGGQSIFSLSNATAAAPTAASQSLNVVQIKHVSMSIQNHGFGLLNSAINQAYKLIRRLINLVSKQTSDDKLRAILAKHHQQVSSSGVSYDRALKLARKFRVSHQANEIPTKVEEQPGADLDQIRQSITQLGNSLAFMRLLKSGALNCASKSVDYLPDLDDTSMLRIKRQLPEHCRQQQTSLVNAADNFDSCLEDLEEHFSPKTDYFSIVLRLFSEALNPVAEIPAKVEQEENQKSADDNQRSRASRFELFHLLIPSLTINFIDHIINAKERVLSRSSANRVGALICDDGFSMGVAFLLIVLRQTADFAKLEWFKEVRNKLESDQAEVRRKAGGDTKQAEESLRQTSSMTLRRLDRLKLEYESLSYNLKSALLLFRSSTIR